MIDLSTMLRLRAEARRHGCTCPTSTVATLPGGGVELRHDEGCPFAAWVDRLSRARLN